MKPGDQLTLRIEKAVAGGRMLARHEGAVALVADAIPGELVAADIEKIQRGTIWATTRRVIEPSGDRVDPFCDGACGGNAYAHVRYERQIALKRDVLRDAFVRLAHVQLPDDISVAPSNPYGYRMRARLHVRNHRLGFFREGTHTLCEVGPTRQLLPDTVATLDRLAHSLARAERALVTDVELSENCEASERACHLALAADGDPSALTALTQVEGLTGASCGGARSRALTLWGSPTVTDTIDGVNLQRHAHAFFQGNRYLLSTLAARVVDYVCPRDVLDLYAGVGLFSAVLAARKDAVVTAIEGDAVSAHDLKHNLAPYASAKARHQSVEAFLNTRPKRPDAVIVDPPRTGMTKEAMHGVLALAVPCFVYVSCDVATLARDVRTMMERGYRLAHIEAFDLFPNTAHVETLAVLMREA
jgi:tRNA/tmRNA/rRNA uracil-C5-methylase (TrmA/RlmC/RlmD family)